MMKNKQKDSLRRFKECEYIVLKVKREEGGEQRLKKEKNLWRFFENKNSYNNNNNNDYNKY